jgi:hypothetical protein
MQHNHTHTHRCGQLRSPHQLGRRQHGGGHQVGDGGSCIGAVTTLTTAITCAHRRAGQGKGEKANRASRIPRTEHTHATNTPTEPLTPTEPHTSHVHHKCSRTHAHRLPAPRQRVPPRLVQPNLTSPMSPPPHTCSRGLQTGRGQPQQLPRQVIRQGRQLLPSKRRIHLTIHLRMPNAKKQGSTQAGATLAVVMWSGERAAGGTHTNKRCKHPTKHMSIRGQVPPPPSLLPTPNQTKARHDTTRHDTTRHDTTRHDTTRHDTTRHDTTHGHACTRTPSAPTPTHGRHQHCHRQRATDPPPTRIIQHRHTWHSQSQPLHAPHTPRPKSDE